MVVSFCASSKAALTIYDIGLTIVKGLEKKVNRCSDHGLGLQG